MTPERWERVWALFDDALALPTPERTAFLERACRGDEELRAELESLLRADAASHPVFGASHVELAAVLAEPAPVAGRTIGPYRLIREIGHGGMGVVYLAEREDVGKRVALKLVRGSLAAPESIERFLLERRLLARLEHPHIARLLDAGITDDGTPFFAMEHVEGEPIDRFCDERRLPVRARLELFGKVCDAVQDAHRNLVVHRDLKPSNILVTSAGEPKLLDFGIAKLLGDDAGAEGLTGTGARLMTPEYAAPEQVRGEPVTTATDVYALGMVLYELLCGHRPYRLQGRSWGEIERLVLEQDPPRPSTVVRRGEEARGADGAAETITPEAVSRNRGVSPERLRRELAGDLDTIVLKALEKDPARRYPSVQQLTDDLRRYLQGLPVRARPDRWGYRTRKFVRRHRWGAAAAAVSVLVLLGFSTVTAVQSQRIARERDRARLERDKAQEVSEFLVELFSVANPRVSGGRAVTARELLDQGATRIGRELTDQPGVRAQMLDAIGRAYVGLYLLAEAQPPLERALAVRRQLHGGDHPDVAASLHNLAVLQLDRGELAAAEPLFREALAMRRRLYGSEHPHVAVTLNQMGRMLRQRGDLHGAERLHREALAIVRKRFGERHELVAFALNGLGAALHLQGRNAEAEPVLRQALHTLRALMGSEHPDTRRQIQRLALVLHANGKPHEAEPLFREAVEVAHRTLGEEHPLYADEVTELADFLLETGDLQTAEELYRNVLTIERRSSSPGSRRIARALSGVGQTLLETERPGEAEPFLREALAIMQQHEPGSLATAAVQNALGACLTTLGHYAEAEPLLRESYATARQAFGEQDHPNLREARQRLVTLYEAWSKPKEAQRWRDSP